MRGKNSKVSKGHQFQEVNQIDLLSLEQISPGPNIVSKSVLVERSEKIRLTSPTVTAVSKGLALAKLLRV